VPENETPSSSLRMEQLSTRMHGAHRRKRHASVATLHTTHTHRKDIGCSRVCSESAECQSCPNVLHARARYRQSLPLGRESTQPACHTNFRSASGHSCDRNNPNYRVR